MQWFFETCANISASFGPTGYGQKHACQNIHDDLHKVKTNVYSFNELESQYLVWPLWLLQQPEPS